VLNKEWRLHRNLCSEGDQEPLLLRYLKVSGSKLWGIELLGFQTVEHPVDALRKALLMDFNNPASGVYSLDIDHLDDDDLQKLESIRAKFNASGVETPRKAESRTLVGWERDLFEICIAFTGMHWTDPGFTLDEYIDAGLPINFKNPLTGRTLLHNAAASTVTQIAQTLIETGKCDYLIRNNSEKLAYDLSFELGHDLALCKQLLDLTLEQARSTRIDLKTILTHPNSSDEQDIRASLSLD